MKQFVFILLLLPLLKCSKEKESKISLDNLDIALNVKDSLKKVLDDSTLHSFLAVNRDIVTPVQRRENWIIRNLNENELNQLTKSDNAFLKALGIRGLILKKDEVWFKALIPMLRDTGEYIYHMDGCFGYNTSLPEYLLVEVLRYENMDGILSDEQTRIIDNHILKYKINVIPKRW